MTNLKGYMPQINEEFIRQNPLDNVSLKTIIHGNGQTANKWLPLKAQKEHSWKKWIC